MHHPASDTFSSLQPFEAMLKMQDRRKSLFGRHRWRRGYCNLNSELIQGSSCFLHCCHHEHNHPRMHSCLMHDCCCCRTRTRAAGAAAQRQRYCTWRRAVCGGAVGTMRTRLSQLCSSVRCLRTLGEPAERCVMQAARGGGMSWKREGGRVRREIASPGRCTG